MAHVPSRNDTAHHRNLHDQRHPLCRGARIARHLVFAAWRPLRALDAMIAEADRVGWYGDSAVLAKARIARDGGWPYLTDEVGEVWK